MAAATPGLGAIKTAAAKYGLDWRALAAIAHHESGLNPGAVGDGGTSFGLFQLHVGGALPKGTPRGQALNPNWNANYAARQIASLGIGKLPVEQQIAQISKRFERPADPTGEINDALSWYHKNLSNAPAGGGTTMPPAGGTATPPQTPTTQVPTQQTQTPMTQAGTPTAQAQGAQQLLAYLLTQDPHARQHGQDPNQGLVNFLSNPQAQQTQAPQVNPFQTLQQPTTQAAPTVTAPTGMTPKPKPGQAPTPGGTVPTHGAFDLPVNTTHVIGTPYKGTHTVGNWESDNALDLAVPKGSPIYAVQDGTIGSQFGSLDSGNPRFAGLRLHLQTKGNEFYYAHLSRFAKGIMPGAHVTKGQIIGYSGVANGVAHLHIGAENGNPLSLFGYK